MNLPVGVHFVPTDEELVEYYLKRKRAGLPVDTPPDIIHDMDIYSTEPWNLGVGFEHGDKGNMAFFFTQRHPVGSTGYRASRTAGDGFWHGRGSAAEIKGDSGVIIGSKFTFAFKDTSGKRYAGNDWIMHEYVLPPDQVATTFQDKALCKIFKTTPKQMAQTKPHEPVRVPLPVRMRRPKRKRVSSTQLDTPAYDEPHGTSCMLVSSQHPELEAAASCGSQLFAVVEENNTMVTYSQEMETVTQAQAFDDLPEMEFLLDQEDWDFENFLQDDENLEFGAGAGAGAAFLTSPCDSEAEKHKGT